MQPPEWNIPLFFGFLIISLLYLLLVRLWLKEKPLLIQTLLFYSGLWIIYFLTGSPLAHVSHVSFTFHMIDMSLLFFIVPPMLLLGLPSSMMRGQNSLFNRRIRRIWSPVISLILFACLFFLYHLPFIFDVYSQYPSIHDGYVFIMFLLSIHAWSPLTNSTQSFQRRSYAFLSGMILMPACLLFIVNGLLGETTISFLVNVTKHQMASHSSYLVLPSWYTSQVDQIVAGIIMIAIHKLAMVMTYKMAMRMN
ncbi:cytochrome c oxidase assembly protein [Bacillus spongiae]|uniref:Cytochrome c oxidase assembly protein n=1 Tax=Bacillus spongiae TaxID=2683610 RepID=A0ABU8HFQ9_9BACI